MKVSYAWLKAVAPTLDVEPEALADHLAARGAPVEDVEDLAAGLEGIVVGRVDAVEPHPNADRLRICRVVAGAHGGEPLQVVCGAPNVEAGGLYPFAPVGSTLPGGMEIGEAELRGELSRGMLCSAREVALGTDQSGLLVLPRGLEPGTPLVDALALRDWRLDVEVTANRGDLLSHAGVAREAAPGGQADLELPAVPGAPPMPELELVRDAEEATASGVTVRIEDPDLCWRYLGAVVRGVEIGPSPAWLQARLRAAGARPINNVVDATNYVLLELGQPLHAFDLATLADDTIVVRRPRDGEDSFTTLDGQARDLGPDMLMICDTREPVAVGGVMGGLDSEVSDATTDVLLECALFEPGSIRATRRALNLSTDASYRFERGVDPSGMEAALRRALEIIVATAGGEVQPAVADCVPRPWEPPTVELRVGRVEHLLGVAFTPERVAALLEPLGFRVLETEGSGPGAVLTVSVPGWRSYDVTREVDLIEEVARTHGYDAFPEELAPYRPTTVPDHPLFRLEDRVRDLLVGRGLFEAQTPAFVPAAEGEVRVANPVSKEEDHLRSRLLPSLVRRVEHNWARGLRDVRLFELGTAFLAPAEAGGAPREEARLALVLTGRRRPEHWSSQDEAMDLWDLKGLAAEVAALVRGDATLEPGAAGGPDGLVPGACFEIRTGTGSVVGRAGRLAEDAADAPAWADPVYGLEIVLPAEPAEPGPPAFRPLPAYPAVDRDLALLVPDAVPAARVESVIRGAAGEHLESIALFDRYAGKGIGEGTRSLAFRLRFRSGTRTLTDDEVDRAAARVVETLREELGVEQRG